MESLLLYGSDSDSEADPMVSEGAPSIGSPEQHNKGHVEGALAIQGRCAQPISSAVASPIILPPPPDDLLAPCDKRESRLPAYGGRVRSFPHVDGNYALHVYIPVILPSYTRMKVVPVIERETKRFPGLQFSDERFTQVSLSDPGSDQARTERLGQTGYHISLSRTVPIRIHQVESITSMLRHKLSSQKKYLVEFVSCEAFVNDERTRTFLALEGTTIGLSEIHKQVSVVDQVFKLHNLPPFYKNPRPHISLAWALGDVESSMRIVAEELNKAIVGTEYSTRRNVNFFSYQVRKIDCKIGQRVHTVWESPA